MGLPIWLFLWQTLVEILGRLRLGVCTDKDAAILAATKRNVSKEGILPTKVTTKQVQVCTGVAQH